jgi:hypothetical protein
MDSEAGRIMKETRHVLFLVSSAPPAICHVTDSTEVTPLETPPPSPFLPVATTGAPTLTRLSNDLQVEYTNVQDCTSCSSEHHVTEVTDVTDLGRTPPMGGVLHLVGTRHRLRLTIEPVGPDQA